MYRVTGKKNVPTPVGHVLAPGETFDAKAEGYGPDDARLKRAISGGHVAEIKEAAPLKKKPGRPRTIKRGD